MDKNKYSSDMEKEIREICTELNDGQIAVVQATEKLLDLFSVSNRRKLFIDFRNSWFGNRHSATNISNDEIDEFLGN